MELIDLDQAVINALRLFREESVPSLAIPEYKRPIVLGSGNAFVTARMLFHDRDAVFADEGSYVEKLRAVKGIDGAVLISASGAKHAPVIARDLRKQRVETNLLTCNPDAPAEKFCRRVFVYPRAPEPYTYNTSTYLGMLLGSTGEDPGKMLAFIERRIDPLLKRMRKYDAYSVIVPPELQLACDMFSTKFDELFGPMVNGRVFSSEQAKHSKDIVRSDKELFVSFGFNNRFFGRKRLNLPLPRNVDYAGMMAIGYYVIGRVQRLHPPYFKNNIRSYIRRASDYFGSDISLIVG